MLFSAGDPFAYPSHQTLDLEPNSFSAEYVALLDMDSRKILADVGSLGLIPSEGLEPPPGDISTDLDWRQLLQRNHNSLDSSEQSEGSILEAPSYGFMPLPASQGHGLEPDLATQYVALSQPDPVSLPNIQQNGIRHVHHRSTMPYTTPVNGTYFSAEPESDSSNAYATDGLEHEVGKDWPEYDRPSPNTANVGGLFVSADWANLHTDA